MPPVIPDCFTLTKSTHNVQRLYGTTAITKYAMNYVAKLDKDKGDRYTSWADSHTTLLTD